MSAENVTQNHYIAVSNGTLYECGVIRGFISAGGGTFNAALVQIPAGETAVVRIQSYDNKTFSGASITFTQRGFALRIK